MSAPRRGQSVAGGIDIGGTKCLGVVLFADGTVEREERAQTPSGAAAIVQVLHQVALVLGPLPRLGVGAAGLVTPEGVLRAGPNLPGVFELALREELSALLGIDVIVENDATCAAYAEWRLGAAAGASNMILVTLGTGIGAGVVMDGRLQRGAHGFAGEPGHMVVEPNGPLLRVRPARMLGALRVGQRAHGLAREAATGGELSRVVARVGHDPEAVRGEHVELAAREGDPEALAVMDRFARWVALGLVNLTNLLDPELIVLGGGVVGALDLLLEPVQRHLRGLLYASAHRPLPRVVAAALGERAGAVGAALLAAAPRTLDW